MAGVSITLDGAEAALAALARAVEATDKPKALFDEIGQALTLSTQHRFETQTDPDGNPWPVSIRALLDGGRTLTDTGRLRGSITWQASGRDVAVGTDVIYSAIHQLGGTITAKTSAGLTFRVGGRWITKSSVTLPARPFLGLDADGEAEIEAIAADWLGSALQGTQFGGVAHV